MSPPDDDDTLLERATHDLLNPVASILGLGDTIRTRGAGLDDATLKQFGASIARNAARLEAAIRDLGRATRMQRRTPAASVESVALGPLLSGLAGDRVAVDVAEDATAEADLVFLSDVVRRLLDNALEHSTGVVVVTAGPGWVEVRDDGVGFTEEGLAKAFDPMSAGANTKGERGAGLGLGLYIARRLIEACGGTLTARSTPGEGSTFRIELPG